MDSFLDVSFIFIRLPALVISHLCTLGKSTINPQFSQLTYSYFLLQSRSWLTYSIVVEIHVLVSRVAEFILS
jgi:hypothetical protein